MGRYGWIGREFDSATGLYHGITGRNYNPQTGRWNSQDSALFAAQDANLYRYGQNSPTNIKDPSGQGQECPWWDYVNACKIAEQAANLAKSSANYVAEKAQQLLTTIQVAGQTIKAKFVQTLNAAGQAIQYVVTEGGQALVIVGGQVVQVAQNVAQKTAQAFADQVTKFGQSITKLWNLAKQFGANAQLVINAIVNNPGQFVKNLASGVGDGIKKFFNNFGPNLQDGLFSWLSKYLPITGIQLPAVFNVQAIGTFLFQLMGLTADNIKGILVRKAGISEAQLAQAQTMLDALLNDGPAGVFQMVKDQVDPTTIINSAINAGINWMLTNVTPKVVAKVAGLFNPFPVSLLLSIYEGFEWFFNNVTQLVSVFNTVVDGIGQVASGNTTALANSINTALKGLVVPTIDFAASQVPGLSGLPQQISKLVQAPRQAVENAIGKFLDTLIGKAKAVIGLKPNQEIVGQVGKVLTWQVGADTHQLWAVVQKGVAHVYLASSPPLDQGAVLEHWRNLFGGEKQVDAQLAKGFNVNKAILALAGRIQKLDPKKDAGAIASETAKLEGLELQQSDVDKAFENGFKELNHLIVDSHENLEKRTIGMGVTRNGAIQNSLLRHP